jgi:hypothetical protein
MRALSAADLLTVWERAAHDGPIQRALALLSAACPECNEASLARVSIGRRDALLLHLRESTFGPRLTGIVRCATCDEPIELAVLAADLASQGAAHARAAIAHPGKPSVAAKMAASDVDVDEAADVEIDGYTLRVRPPNSADMLAASHADLARARVELLRRCVLSVRRDGMVSKAQALPESVLSGVEQHLAHVDPQADLRLRLTCPACGQLTTTVLDIVSFFWREIDAWACRMLREVHTLASAYGWTEEAILALTPLRRQCYLELVGG